jgi:hypothetical protein
MMVEFFDSGFEQPQATTPARTYEPLPIGQHKLEIIAASVGDVEWRATTDNPRGECLRLRLSGGREYGFVFADIPKEKRWLFKALELSLGIEPAADGRIGIGPAESLVGQHARVEIGHYTTRAGETRATVKRWLPMASAAKPAATSAATSAPARCRTQSTKAAAVFRDGDGEFPF